jgi:hypothetical protein
VRTIGRISPDPITEFPQVGGGSTGGECKASETRPAGPQGPRSMPDDLVRLLLALTTDPLPPCAGRPPGRGQPPSGPAIRSQRASDKMRLVW